MPLDGHLEVDATPDAVTFTLTVQSTGTEPVTLEFPTGQRADVTVTDDGPVWQWSDGRMFTQSVSRETLAPGESVAEKLVWADPEPGQYTATATLAATTVDLSVTSEFEVP